MSEFESTADTTYQAHTALDDLARANIDRASTKRLEYILSSLDEADELNGPLCWQTEIWDGCTIEELIGALIEAENLLGQGGSLE